MSIRMALHHWLLTFRSAGLTASVTVKIKQFYVSPSSSTPSALPSQVDLNFSTQLRSSRLSSLTPTATIHGQDFSVFTTDSQQSTWLPSSSPSLPALSAQSPAQQQPPLQDFVLFDQPITQHRPHNRNALHPPTRGINLNQQHRSQHLSPSLQNQRVANIIQATGHPTTSSAFTNRYSSTQNSRPQLFYASSAPFSALYLNTQNRAQQRPPVPLFPKSTGSIPHGKQGNKMFSGNYTFYHQPPANMRLQPHSELDLLDFATFDGGATTEAVFASPANQTYDLSSSVPSSVSNMGTVSPQELLLHEPYLSAPSSTALTALTSPSIFDGSPDFDHFDISPSFGHSDLDNPDSWFSLFPDAKPPPEAQAQTQTQAEQQTQPQPDLIQSVQQTVQPSVEQAVHSVEASPATQSEDLEVSSPGSGHQRRKSSASSPSGRHSSVAGVGSRRRDKPLPPIIVEDPSDVVAMKRARNTLAARKSRERKAQRLEELEAKIEELIAERDRWKNLALAHGASKE
ncbi:hypothetical protein QBC45DRAFT_432306 [Copromyces sp. CBS 386.78]|nr:hypothetical protein QBC45DRAFT_432306 [Copromyces sp. CBS 386.78]